MDKAHLLIRTDQARNCYLIEAVMGADRITLATATTYADAFTIATNLRSWTRSDPENLPFAILDRSFPLQ